MFQITINATSHDVKQTGLEMVDKLDIPADTPRYLIVFTPMGVSLKIGPVSKDYLEKKHGRPLDLSKAFPVFHCPVDSKEVFGPKVGTD